MHAAPGRLVYPVLEDSERGWGPTRANVRAELAEIPYAPFSKAERLGRIADWTDAGARDNKDIRRRRNYREPGVSGLNSSFSYCGKDEDASFSRVEFTGRLHGVGAGGGHGSGRGGGYRRGWGNRGGRGGSRSAWGRGGGGRGGHQQRAAPVGSRASAAAAVAVMQRQKASVSAVPVAVAARMAAAAQQGNDLSAGPISFIGQGNGIGATTTVNASGKLFREPAIKIGNGWKLVKEVDFSFLSKLSLKPPTPETLTTHGTLYQYEKNFDRISTKTPKPLQAIDRTMYNPTTSDDPVLQKLAKRHSSANVFATDAIMALLMTSSRSVYSWDIVITKLDDKVWLDKRPDSLVDYVTVNENAPDPPHDNTDNHDSIHSASNLALEATYINANFAQQVVDRSKHLSFQYPNPFHSMNWDLDSPPSEPVHPEPTLASVGYQYRKWNLGSGIEVIARTELDGFIGLPTGPKFLTVKALNEYDSRVQATGMLSSIDWTTKLDDKRGAILANEMKLNMGKLARWTVRSVLAGADSMKLGWIARKNVKDLAKHNILGTTNVTPREFALQINLSWENAWGVLKALADVLLGLPNDKYVLMKDPNRPLMRLYRVAEEPPERELGDGSGDSDS